MEVKKIYSNRSFWVITILSVLTAAALSAGIYFGMDQAEVYFIKYPGNKILAKIVTELIQPFEPLIKRYYQYILPAVFGIFLLAGWSLWLVLKISMSKSLGAVQEELDRGKAGGKKKKDFVDQKIEQDRKRRLYLHTLSVFQREGRLLDFFDEDLNNYDDEQIGAAVRSIQEDCKKVIKKYINPSPVIESEEGEPVTIEEGFDIDAVKLIGNVSGQPPFEGILNHRGWKAGKKEIPKLSDIQDSTIITPAEVEIQ